MSTRSIYLNRLVLHDDGHINVYPQVVTGQKTFADAVREQRRQLCKDVYTDKNTDLAKLDDSHWLMLVDGRKAFQFVYDGYEDSYQPGKIRKALPPEETERSSLFILVEDRLFPDFAPPQLAYDAALSDREEAFSLAVATVNRVRDDTFRRMTGEMPTDTLRLPDGSGYIIRSGKTGRWHYAVRIIKVEPLAPAGMPRIGSKRKND